MANPRITLLTNVMSTDEKVIWQPSTILDTNDRYPHGIWRWDEDYTDGTELTTRVGITGSVEIPASYSGSPVFYIVWRTTKTTGTNRWEIDYTVVSGDDTESLDPSADERNIAVDDDAGSATMERMVASVSGTAGDFAANATLLFGLYVNGPHANHDLVGATILEDFLLGFTE